MVFSKFLALSFLVSGALGGTCRYIQAQKGDGCWALANRCGITQAQLKTFNPGSNFCGSIKANQYVCCSEDSLPDFSPKPYSNGTCYTYTVQHDDTCDAIAKAHQMNETKIPGYNNETWGWSGCHDLQAGQRICLSEGTPPFPAPLTNAICGPQVPGTTQPLHIPAKNWTLLNPCPLNACCDIWGQCGITPEFCTVTESETGAPGTSKNGTNGCISNCGTKVTNNEQSPPDHKRIAYFESWNMDRPCLNMDISKLQGNSYYTHVHWAFGNITTDWKVDVSGAQDQFEGLKELTGFKRVLSFGGWGFSTSHYTFSIFRNGVKDGNRQILAKNVANFIVENDLEGIDFDWEYPGVRLKTFPIAPDSKDSGENYLEFLKLVRQNLPSGKSLSIAAPASFWYLKGFPIKKIAEVVDYIVYMTYDLHGQWDWNNTFADPGCAGSACLRSQVNKTETEYALAMITKAGVQSTKVVAGLPLYGRSFKMAKEGCSGPECHFTGPQSGATKGACTNTSGYLANYEIYELIVESQNPELYGNFSITQYQDEGDVLIYGGDNWVSWLSPESYVSRRSWIDGLNFGGTSDWAVDLNTSYLNNGTGSAYNTGYGASDFKVCDYSKTFSSLDDLAAAAPDLRTDCIAVYSLRVLINMLETAYQNYTNVNSGYDALFGYYVTYIENLVPTVLPDEFMFNLSTTEPYANVPNTGYGMDYFQCTLGNGNVIPCSDLNQTSTANEDTLRYDTTALKLSDANGYDAGLAKAGLVQDWVDRGDYTMDYTFETARGGSWTDYFKFSGFPIKNESMVVPNPKDIVTKALPSIPTLRNEMRATMMDIMLGQWFNGSSSDAAEAYSTPVFMLMQAIEGMAEAKKLGQQEKKKEQEEEKRKKDFIVMIISVVLLFVPVVGEEVAAAAGLATLARSVAIAGELANGALAIYDTVQNPSSAVVNILGMLLGVGSIAKVARDGKGLASVAKLRREMKPEEIASLGKIFESNDNKLQSIMKVCNWKK